ncbi:MAG: hypothetical protein NVS2B12_20740 [Ktedonobacteraceae bacterium]
MQEKHINKTILVVEDDREIGEVIVEVLLEETIHHAYLVTNAHEALQVVQNIIPDLFLFDYQLPSITGLQLFDLINTTEEFKDIPTILMSANLPWDELDRRNIIGLEKPFDLDDFVGLVKRIIEDKPHASKGNL